MLLIDALHINSSGGLQLLDYLVNELIKRELNFYLLADARCKGHFDYVINVEYRYASLKNRKEWYNRDMSGFTAVLCFGNIPVPHKIDIPVYTYYHNINYLTLHGLPSTKETLKTWLKREVYRHYKNNTDRWFVQTSNTRNELIKHLKVPEDKIIIMPFYNIPAALNNLHNIQHGDDYVYVANYTGSKQHEELLHAWTILHERGFNKTLHLTIPETQTSFLHKVNDAINKGVKIINHGFIPFEDVFELYKQSKAIVYPSLNESLGLGIVEAIKAGCDVIGSDLPFIHSICKPSQVFDPYSATSIAEAVIKYEKTNVVKSQLLIHNQIDELINYLYK